MRLMIIGAHPDDADYFAGGFAALYRGLGHDVLMVSLTNGDAGHHLQPGPALAARRAAEAQSAAAVIGARYLVLDHHDAELLPTLDNRRQVIGLIRSYDADLVLTHRPNDYHPDHRYTSQLVQDAAYMVTVPAVLPGTRHLSRNPVIMYLSDTFEKPCPFTPAALVDVGPVLEKVLDMLHCHKSQFYEWLPYNQGIADQVPEADEARRAWLGAQVRARLRKQAERFSALATACYGRPVEYAEAFEPCEYGAPFDAAARRRLFPFLPA
jgi:LmbE family N-acetylglucosaminyl deacetylase